jgi:hypothetical protein
MRVDHSCIKDFKHTVHRVPNMRTVHGANTLLAVPQEQQRISGTSYSREGYLLQIL